MPFILGTSMKISKTLDLGPRSWLNPNNAGKGGVGIILNNKPARFVSTHGALYDNIIV